MTAIFYDLETSDREPIGQILNYSFIAVDESFAPFDECSGDVRISRLELPTPEAILKNRVDVLALQESEAPLEPQAMLRISSFIESVQKRSKQKPVLIGFNSSKFDLLRLRTSFIRNGLNPYFGGNIVYRDVFDAVRSLAMRHPDFPLPTKEKEGAEKGSPPERVRSLSLEAVSRELGLLSGVQSHHSREDVILTISLAKTLHERFGLNPCTYEAFELSGWMKKREGPGLFWSLSPQYELSSGERIRRSPLAFHQGNHRSALFTDLEAYLRGDGRRSLRWFSLNTAHFFSGGEVSPTHQVVHALKVEDVATLSSRAREEFKALTVENFFERSTCDIEQDIYRVDFSGISTLYEALWRGNREGLSKAKNKDLDILELRYRLKSTARLDEKGTSTLQRYGLYRYGGKLQLSKNANNAEAPKKGSEESPLHMHPTLQELFDRLGRSEREAKERGSEADERLLKHLRKFYETSEIVRVCGAELGVSVGSSGRNLGPARAA